MSSPATPGDIRTLIEAWYRSGIDEVDPVESVRRAIEWNGSRLTVDARHVDLASDARVVAVAIGKAAAGMAHGLDSVFGDRIDDATILTRDGHAESAPTGWTVFEARHPVPDERGVEATRHILETVDGLGPNDLVIVLISGGGSALLELPREPLGLDDIQETTRLLLRAGAPIQDLNAVRSELSMVKGGGLRASIGEATCVSLILSDVLGNDPTVIASGPTIAREPQPDVALHVLAAHDLTGAVPRAVIKALAVHRESHPVAPGDDIYAIVGDNEAFVERIVREATLAGFRAELVLPAAEGEARDLANHFIDLAVGVNPAIEIVFGGGEATVTVRGDGQGGRNTEFALAAAVRIATEADDWVVASLASDGQDGTLDDAGAIVDRATVSRGVAAGFDAGKSLDMNDSGTFLSATGDLFSPGPTGTNVNDVYVAFRLRGDAG
jgi:glycerate 2-kinase